MEETFVDQLDPLLRHDRLEAVLCLRQNGFLECPVRREQGDQAGRFVDDAALETDRGIAGVDAATDTVGGKSRLSLASSR